MAIMKNRVIINIQSLNINCMLTPRPAPMGVFYILDFHFYIKGIKISKKGIYHVR